MGDADNRTVESFSPRGYLFATAFWTAVFPAMISSVLLLLFIVGVSLFFRDASLFVGAILIAGAVTGAVGMGYRVFRKRLVATVCMGDLPDSFALRVLPFFLALF
jgi:membrane-bound ClpP family serine protease